MRNVYDGFRKGHDEWMGQAPETPDEPARVLAQPSNNSRDWTPKLRPDKTGLFAAIPAAGTSKAAAASSAAKLVADLEAQYARASPSAARAVPFAPDVAVPRRRPALMRRPVERCAVLPSAPPLEPPCATVAAARALHHALRCLPCAGRLRGRKRRRCTPTRATRSRAHCRTVHPHAAMCV